MVITVVCEACLEIYLRGKLFSVVRSYLCPRDGTSDLGLSCMVRRQSQLHYDLFWLLAPVYIIRHN